MMIQSASPPFR